MAIIYMGMIRLDKYLSTMGVGTRSEVKIYIKKKLIEVNGSVLVKPEQKVDTDKDIIKYRGEAIGYKEYEYYMLNKPSGYVSAVRDNVHPTVISLIQSNRKDLFPVGRLDIDTEGLLILTNDGVLSHNLLAPGKHVGKTYYTRVKGIVTEEDVLRFQEGVDIGEPHITKPAHLVILESGNESLIELTIQEGKFHQVKRMFEAVDKQVLYLRRIAMGSLHLDESLALGEYRLLTQEEVAQLKG